MAAEPRPRIEGHEAERFRGRRVDHFPDVDVHAQAELFELVDERDVDAAKDVFQKLGHFRGARGADRNDAAHHLAVERLRGTATRRIQSADDLRDLGQSVLLVARVFALGGKSEVEIANHVLVFLARGNGAAQTTSLQNGQDEVFGRTRIGCRLEDNQLSFLQVRIDGESGLLHIT